MTLNCNTLGTRGERIHRSPASEEILSAGELLFFQPINNGQVTRQHVGSWGYPSSSVFRGCASSLNVACELDAELPTAAVPSSNTSRHPRHHPSQEGNSNSGASGNPRDGSSQQQPLCCTKDLCNGSEDAPGWQRRSEEHLRVLTEGNPRRREGYFSGFSAIAPASGHGSGTGTAGVMDGGNVGDEDDNSAKSARGGSRVATVLVIVGTFSQVFWLLSRLIE